MLSNTPDLNNWIRKKFRISRKLGVCTQLHHHHRSNLAKRLERNFRTKTLIQPRQTLRNRNHHPPLDNHPRNWKSPSSLIHLDSRWGGEIRRMSGFSLASQAFKSFRWSWRKERGKREVELGETGFPNSIYEGCGGYSVCLARTFQDCYSTSARRGANQTILLIRSGSFRAQRRTPL